MKLGRCLNAIKRAEKRNWANGNVTIFTLVVVALALAVLVLPSDPLSDVLVTLPLLAALAVAFPTEFLKIYLLLSLGLVWLLGMALLLAFGKAKRLKGCK